MGQVLARVLRRNRMKRISSLVQLLVNLSSSNRVVGQGRAVEVVERLRRGGKEKTSLKRLKEKSYLTK